MSIILTEQIFWNWSENNGHQYGVISHFTTYEINYQLTSLWPWRWNQNFFRYSNVLWTISQFGTWKKKM